MIRRWLAPFLVLLAALVLSACGGDGGSTPPAPPVADAGSAQNVLAGATATLDGSHSHGAEGTGLTYAWTLTDKPSGSTAALTGASTAAPQLATDVAGSYVASLVVSDGTQSSAAATVTITGVATSALTIVTTPAEPLSGTVQLSLSGPVYGADVSWYADLAPLGSGATASWNAGAAVNGSHLVAARVQVSATQTVEIRRIVTVGNPAITLGPTVVGSSGTILLKVTATSAAAITSVSASLDGQSLGTLTAVNGCPQILTCNQFVYSLYQFAIDGPGVGSGTHTAVITATDANGATAQATVAVTVSNTPTLTVASPVDGAFVSGSLAVSGSASSDKAGAVTVSADLGGTPIALQGPAANFNGSVDLSGVTPGAYTLTVHATDSTSLVTTVQRSVVVASAPSLAYTPVATLGANARLLATDGQRLVYAAGDQSIHLLDWAAATDVVLQHAADIAYATQWQLSGGQVFASGRDLSDCAVVNCVYRWQADGTRTNLADANPVVPGAVQVWPVAHDGKALWSNDSPSSYTLYDTASGAFTLVTPDAGVSSALPSFFDLAVQGGVAQVAYAGVTGSGLADVFAWRSDTATSIRLSTPGQYSAAPQTDGVRVAWSALPAASSAAVSALVVAPAGGGAPATLSTTMGQFLLRDGVLAWIEMPATTAVLKASAGNGTSTLSSSGNTTLVGNSGGTVVYDASGRTFAWKSASGQGATLVDVAPTGALVAGGKLVFTQGGSGTLYAITID